MTTSRPAPAPKNWPPTVQYLHAPQLAPALTAAQAAALRARRSDAPTLAAGATPTPSPLVRIRPIRDAAHPAAGQCGLFAARRLAPGALVAVYLGRVHAAADDAGSVGSDGSDYVVWLSRAAGVAVDAARAGNEARFVNDYRGVAARPNAAFGPAFCERWGQLAMAVWVVAGGRGIPKGAEILVSYGKGFWAARAADA